MASSILTDFVTRRGLVVLGTNYVTSSTDSTGTLQVDGGAAIAKNLIVGTTATIYGPVTINGPTTLTNGLLVLNTATFNNNVTVNGDLNVSGVLAFDQISVSYLLRAGSLSVTTISTFSGTATFNSDVFIDGVTTITQKLYVTGATTATLAGDGSIVTQGGIYIGDNLIVASTLTSSVNTLSNSIYTLGGIGIARDLDVGGNVVISGNLRVLGTQTIIDSTSTAIQDPIIDIGTGIGNAPLGGPDGYNKGIVIHYHDAGDNHMFIGRSDLTGRLVVRDNIDSGLIEVPNQDYTTQGSYSGFDIGNVKVWDSTASTGTTTGALTVVGGVGVGQNLYVGGTIYGNLTGTATKSNNLVGGAAGSIVYQSNTDSTAFLPLGDGGLVLLSNGSTPYWGAVTGVTVDYSSTATNLRFGFSGAIPYQLSSGITGFTSNLSWNSSTNRLSVSNVSITSGVNSTGTTTGALVVEGGVGISQDVWIGGSLNVVNTATFDNIVVTNTGTGITVNNIYVSGSSTFNTININGLTTVGNLTGGDTTVTNLTVLGNTDLNSLTVSGHAGFNTFNANTATITNLSATNFTLLSNFTAPSLYVVGTSTLHNTLIEGTLQVTSATTLDSTLSVASTASFTGIVHILNTSNAISTSTGALIVDGGVGIQKDLWVGGNAYINGELAVTTGTINQFANQTVIIAGTDTAVNTSTGNITIWNTSNLQSVTGRGATTNNAIIITNASESLSTSQGALQVTGGVGIGQNLYVGGITNLQDLVANNSTLTSLTIVNNGTVGGTLYVTSSTASTGTNSGALVVTGGVGIGGDLYVNGNAYVNGETVVTTATINQFANQTFITAGTDTAVNTSTGNITIWNTSNLQSVTNRGATTTNAISISNTTSSDSTITGALVVSGGVGIGGDLYARNIFDNNSRVVTQATLGSYGLSSLTAGTDTAVNTSTGAVTVWNTSTFQSITSRTPTTDVAIGVTNTTNSTSTTSGALTVSGGVGIGGNLWVGGEIVAQKLTIEYTTVTTTLVVTDDVITTKNTTESTSTTSGALVVAGGVGIGGALFVGTSSYIDGSLILTTATVNLYASKTIISAGTDTAINTSTGNVTIWNTSTLQSITNRGATTNNAVHFTNATASTGTATGAVLVDGGIGVKDSVYVGNRVGFTSRVYQYYNPVTDSLDTVFE
jgi:hypothetical protein